MTIKATPIVGGTPDGGANGDILTRDNTAEGGYKWGTSPGTPKKIVSGTTSLEIVDSLTLVNFPWATNGAQAFRGKVANVDFMKVAARSAIVDPQYPGVAGDVIVSFATGTAAKVRVVADTFSGRDLVQDGLKLDGIQAQAQKNPTVVSELEKADAFNVAETRTFSPRDIFDIATALEVGNYPKVTAEEIQVANTILEDRSFAPADVHGIVTRFAIGEVNPARVNSTELSNLGGYTTLRSFAPSDVLTAMRGYIASRMSGPFIFPGAEGTITWNHGFAEPPFSLQVRLVCQIANGGYVPGDIIVGEYAKVSIGYTVFARDGQIQLIKGAAEPQHANKINRDTFTLTADRWRVVFVGIWSVLV